MLRLRKNKARLKTSRNGLTFKKLQFFLILERFIEKHKTSWYNRKCCIATWLNMRCLYEISYKKLWMLLVERDITKLQLRKDLSLATGTMSTLNKGEAVWCK